MVKINFLLLFPKEKENKKLTNIVIVNIVIVSINTVRTKDATLNLINCMFTLKRAKVKKPKKIEKNVKIIESGL